MRGSLFFFIILFGAILTQSWTWQRLEFVDEQFWVQRVALLREDIGSGDVAFNPDRHAAHPAAPLLFLAAVWPATDSVSLRAAVVSLASLLIAAATMLTRSLREKSYWWLAVAAILLFQPLYMNANPVDVVFAVLLVVLFLLLWRWLQTDAAAAEKNNWLGAAGIGWGAAGALRLISAQILMIPAVFFVLWTQGWRAAARLIALALLVAIVLNPWWWHRPAIFFQAAFWDQMSYFSEITATEIWAYRLNAADFLTRSPLAVGGLTLALALGLLGASPMPKQMLWLGLGATGLLLVVVLKAHVQSYRYFMPLLIWWELLLPLLVVYGWKQRSVNWAAGVMGLVAAAYALVFWWSVNLPLPVSL